ncbi:uncharacterized protein F5891DRAFT_988734 [Suillus fuscotomentosus]|uniref:Uncharacterized protein n=1 Tax=Suillus fuscotomentosus TaxID=1912939 RepID=A0AAD4DNY5_9AGAM|nr:uncharacterized protein F5891DRAFT_988734 [Suillus fuscotomentosus]KAG1886871.1 hypothetical protein F5891DRAFT_988734 [Suillus fuscotomentosus]
MDICILEPPPHLHYQSDSFGTQNIASHVPQGEMDQTMAQDVISPDPAPPALPASPAPPAPPAPPALPTSPAVPASPAPMPPAPMPPAPMPPAPMPPAPMPLTPMRLTPSPTQTPVMSMPSPMQTPVMRTPLPMPTPVMRTPSPMQAPAYPDYRHGTPSGLQNCDNFGEGNGAEPAQPGPLQCPTAGSFLDGPPSPLESAAIPAPQVNGEDPLCRLIDVWEFDALRLMTKFQPDLKLFVCERCRCGVWADQLVGHIINNHKQHLSHSVKRTTLEITIKAASQKLGAAEYSQRPIVLPKRVLPPLPWLLEPVRGFQCRHCPYVAGTFDSVGDHGKKTHPRHELGPCISKQDQPVFAQRLFSKNQYFVVHMMLQNVGPDHLFAKFYSTLSARYINGAFVTGDLSDTSDVAEHSPFLTNTGWAEATKGYSLATLRDLSVSKVVKQDIDCIARIKGIGAKYLSMISSASEIDHALLDELTSWRTRYRPFQILQERHSVEGYGVHCDRLIMMILRIKSIQTDSDEGTSSEASSDYESHGECEGIEEDIIIPGLDWNDMDFADGDGDEDEDEEGERGPISWPDEDGSENLTCLSAADDHPPYPIFLNAIQKRRAKILRESCADPDSSEEQLMEAYHLLLLSAFTTHTNDNPRPLHSFVDSFVISTSVNVQGHFASPHLISSHLSKIVYVGLFSILTEVMKSPDPYQTFRKTMKVWIEPALPRLQFAVLDGPDFTFDGKSLSVTSMTRMYHSVYRDMVHILEQDLLFGASDADLHPLKTPKEITDNTHERVLGRGVLVSEMQAAWVLMKLIMSDKKLMKKYFSIDSNGHPVPRKGAWEEYLDSIEAFKEHFYFLFHQIPGMPKRGAEEIRAKIVDTSFRSRNLMYLFRRLACIGDYSKSSRNSGNDKLTLHFMARPLEIVLRRFQASVATIGAWAIDLVLPAESIDPHHHCYLLSSKGQRWTSERLSRILQQLTSKHLPGKVCLNMSSLRHILPGIAEHYHISDVLTPRTDDVLHSQLGHNQNTGDRMYARTHQDHPQLTSTMAHRTMRFCDLWQELLGFKEDIPNEDAALSLQASYAHQQSSSKNTLSSLWTRRSSPIAASNPDMTVPPHNHDLLEEIQSMRAALAKLTHMVSSISRAVLPSGTAAPAIQLSRQSNSGIVHLTTASADGLGQSDDLVNTTSAVLDANSPPADYEVSHNQQLAKRRSLPSNSEDEVEERPLKRLRTNALGDDRGPLGIDSLSLHTEERPASADSELMIQCQALQEDISKVYCPQCDVYLSGSDSDIATHFQDKKRQEGINSWHIRSFKAPVAGQRHEIFIHRARDLKFLCPCGFSDYEKHAMQAHLASMLSSLYLVILPFNTIDRRRKFKQLHLCNPDSVNDIRKHRLAARNNHRRTLAYNESTTFTSGLSIFRIGLHVVRNVKKIFGV